MTPAQAVERLVRAAVRLTDADLDRPYAWEEYDEDGLRFALLTAHQHLRETAATVAAARLGAGRPFTEAQRILAQVHEAYRDLTGALAGTSEAELDAAPPPARGTAQWSLREVLRHVLVVERNFVVSIERALEAVRAGREPERVAEDELVKDRPAEDPAGSRHDALDALFRSHTTVLRSLATVTDAELATPSFYWERKGYSVRFRMHRFEEHLRQHTIQVDKTLAALGHPPTEAERLVRNLHNALAGLESVSAGAGVRQDLVDACAAAIDALAVDVERIAR